MYAVIEIGPFQFKVQEGDLIDAPKLEEEVGKAFDIESVLMISDGDNLQVGDPYVKGATVAVEVVKHHRDKKDISFKFRRRKDSRRKIGHRQDLTALKIAKIAV